MYFCITSQGDRNLIPQEFIEIHSAREKNLKNVSLRIPKRKITIFAGVSGSDKSSIVFDTISIKFLETYRSFHCSVKDVRQAKVSSSLIPCPFRLVNPLLYSLIHLCHDFCHRILHRAQFGIRVERLMTFQ